MASNDSAEAIFQFNTTNEAAEGLVNNLNSSSTTDRFISQLSSQGIPFPGTCVLELGKVQIGPKVS